MKNKHSRRRRGRQCRMRTTTRVHNSRSVIGMLVFTIILLHGEHQHTRTFRRAGTISTFIFSPLVVQRRSRHHTIRAGPSCARVNGDLVAVLGTEQYARYLLPPSRYSPIRVLYTYKKKTEIKKINEINTRIEMIITIIKTTRIIIVIIYKHISVSPGGR